jgi:hypothetical protein
MQIFVRIPFGKSIILQLDDDEISVAELLNRIKCICKERGLPYHQSYLQYNGLQIKILSFCQSNLFHSSLDIPKKETWRFPTNFAGLLALLGGNRL